MYITRNPFVLTTYMYIQYAYLHTYLLTYISNKINITHIQFIHTHASVYIHDIHFHERERERFCVRIRLPVYTHICLHACKCGKSTYILSGEIRQAQDFMSAWREKTGSGRGSDKT